VGRGVKNRCGRVKSDRINRCLLIHTLIDGRSTVFQYFEITSTCCVVSVSMLRRRPVDQAVAMVCACCIDDAASQQQVCSVPPPRVSDPIRVFRVARRPRRRRVNNHYTGDERGQRPAAVLGWAHRFDRLMEFRFF